MRFLVMYKRNEHNEAGVPPSKDLIAERGKLTEETAKTGVLLAAEGIHPSSKGGRITFSGEAQRDRRALRQDQGAVRRLRDHPDALEGSGDRKGQVVT
jgi:hypothetical protein